jgi:hypothetical protein
MRRLVPTVLALAIAPAASAAAPVVSVEASARSGAAPLAVTLTARGDAASYRWELGDGGRAEGSAVRHTYAQPGFYTATVTATSATGEAAVAQVVVAAFRLTLAAPRSVRYGERMRLRGRLVPALVGAPVTIERSGVPVARVRTRAGGTFGVALRARLAGPYTARFRTVRGNEAFAVLRPRLEARVLGSATGEPLRVLARVRPGAAGRLRVDVWQERRRVHASAHGASVRLRVRAGRAGLYRVRVAVVPARGYRPARRLLSTVVVEPRLALGARGPSVLALERRLAQLRYALPRVDAGYGFDTYQAVLTFQKVHGLPWTGRVDARVWRALARARVPRPRYRGTHIEISKGRQYLLAVRAGRVQAAVHVSTGATGNTPIGRFRVYRKVPGWDWVLWYPMYFLRGFAIHGYPSVPAYPASHGCVRVPMWIAPRLYASNPYGGTVYVYP